MTFYEWWESKQIENPVWHALRVADSGVMLMAWEACQRETAKRCAEICEKANQDEQGRYSMAYPAYYAQAIKAEFKL